MFKVKNAEITEIKNIPPIAYGGQGGLGDVVKHPDFKQNNLIYFSHAIQQENKYAAIVRRAKLTKENRLTNMQTIWKQTPRTTGRGHYSHRILFGQKNTIHQGKMFITSGDKQKLKPAQDYNSSLGKIIRLNDDGSIPNDNPWANGKNGELAKTFWSIGHRNALGIAFDENGKIWANEMGPKHGDELNLIKKGENYGWPIVSEGNHYSGRKIPNHNTKPEFMPPKIYWIPSIAPSSMTIYKNNKFKKWRGNALIGGLVSRALIRVEINRENAKEIERFEWGKRIREIEQSPIGEIFVLEDGRNARLLKITPM